MRIAKFLAVLALAVGVAIGTAAAQNKGGKGGGKGKGGGGIPAPISVTVAGYSDGGAIPGKYGCGGGNMGVSPEIKWSGAPAGTGAFALIMHDTDVVFGGGDVLHWAIFDIPGSSTGLPENVDKKAELPDGSKQINSVGGTPGFFNPCSPPPTTHHYIIEVYALDAKLDLPASTSRADLEKALLMHTRAKGTYVGL